MDAFILSCWKEPVVGYAGGSGDLKSVQELGIENQFVRTWESGSPLGLVSWLVRFASSVWAEEEAVM